MFMGIPLIVLIYFFYGLAFFSMGLLVALEGGRSSDARLRKALRPLGGLALCMHSMNGSRCSTRWGTFKTSLFIGGWG